MSSLLTRLLATPDDRAVALARIVLGAVMLPHGLQKTLGWFGGYGFDGTMGFFTGQLGIPWIFAFAAVLAESLGALALVVGAAGRVAAAGIVIVMAVAFVMHLPHGFFMNWFGTQAGEGVEFHLLALALGAIVVWRGSGAASVDRLVVAALEDRQDGRLRNA